MRLTRQAIRSYATRFSALEATGCVGGDTELVAASPRSGRRRPAARCRPCLREAAFLGRVRIRLALAQAYARLGLDYYPKLLAAIPFTL
jgi:hypothetical protein